jgi:hypothetical protein
MRSVTADSRAVSEVIGFVLVFSLVLGTISIVYVGGLSGLDDTRDAERVNNAERAFDVLANNFQQMGRGEAPNRATEIKLADARLTTTVNRKVSIKSSGMATAAEANPVAIRYDAPGDTSLVYENGAVIRVQDESAIMLSEPDFLFGDGTVVVRYISLRGSDQGVGASTSTVLVRAEELTSNVLVNRGSSTDVVLKMQTHPDRDDVWEEYYEERISAADSTWGGNCDDRDPTVGGPDTTMVICDGFDVDKLAVSRVRVRVVLT